MKILRSIVENLSYGTAASDADWVGEGDPRHPGYGVDLTPAQAASLRANGTLNTGDGWTLVDEDVDPVEEKRSWWQR